MNAVALKQRRSSDVFPIVSVVVMMLLVGIMVLVGNINMRNIQNTGEIIVTERVEKIVLVETMKTAARERTVLLQRMILQRDPFERDELSMVFHSRGAEFAEARGRLLNSPLSAQERVFLDVQGELSRAAVPLQNEIVDLIATNGLRKAQDILVEQAVPLQDLVLQQLSGLLQYQTDAANAAVESTRQVYRHGVVTMTITTAIALVIATFLLVRLRNLTRERTEYMRQMVSANQAKSVFLAKMSHEIRTPLSAIIGFAEASLEPGQLMEERIKALRIIQQNGIHLLRIINDILDISKIEAEKVTLVREECSIVDVMKDIQSFAELHAQGKGIGFSINYLYPLPRTIRTDALRLKQIVINLTNNALKFTAQGFVQISVGYERGPDRMFIAVSDSGIGLTRAEIATLFQDFQQADAGINRQYGGTGLGLSLSRKLAQLLGGDLLVESAKGVGSKFTLVLNNCEASEEMVMGPVLRGSDALKLSPPVLVEQSKLSGRVLLAEDTPHLAELMTLYLRKVGIVPDLAGNGAEAVQLAAQQRYDLILMDIQMPGVDGITAFEQMRSTGSDVPVVALTANAMKADRERYEQLGFSDFVAKPVDRAELYRVLGRFLAPADDKVAAAESVQPLYPVYPEDDPEYRKLAEKYFEHLPALYDKLVSAFRARGWEDSLEAAHNLKGVGASIGFPDVSQVAASIMFQLRSGNFAEAGGEIEQLAILLRRIETGRSH